MNNYILITYTQNFRLVCLLITRQSLIQQSFYYYQSTPLMKNRNKCSPKVPYLQVKVRTSSKTSKLFGMFNYQIQHQHKKYSLRQSSKIFCGNDGDTVILSIDDIDNIETPISFAQIHIDKYKEIPQFVIKPILQTKLPSLAGPYLVVQQYYDNRDKGYTLKPGNLIKIGLTVHRVLQLKNQEETQTIQNQEETHINKEFPKQRIFQIGKMKLPQEDKIEQKKYPCKICLSNQQQKQDDPLIQPCSCKGSCSKIHLNCLKNRCSRKIQRQKTNGISEYNFKKLSCQICRCPFPQMVRLHTQKDVEIVEIPRPNKPYLILQSSNQFESGDNCDKRIFVIPSDEYIPISIGRCITNKIIINDNSVSRKHAEIVFRQGEFLLFDMTSKFGTLVKFEEEIPLAINESICIQVGRTLYEFTARFDNFEGLNMLQ